MSRGGKNLQLQAEDGEWKSIYLAEINKFLPFENSEKSLCFIRIS